MKDPMAWPWLAWIVLALASFFVLEVFSYMRYGEPGTLSAHVREWSSLHPLIPFGLGCLVGALAWHFWSVRSG